MNPLIFVTLLSGLLAFACDAGKKEDKRSSSGKAGDPTTDPVDTVEAADCFENAKIEKDEEGNEVKVLENCDEIKNVDQLKDLIANPEGFEDCKKDKKLFNRVTKKCTDLNILEMDCTYEEIEKALSELYSNGKDLAMEKKEAQYLPDQCAEYDGRPYFTFVKVSVTDEVVKLSSSAIYDDEAPDLEDLQ